MAVHLPEELLLEILNRLPPKSLLRFTSVCKSWHYLITSPSFIDTHLRVANNAEKQVYLYSRDQLSVHRDHGSFDKITDFKFPFIISRIVSSCNGLMCIHGEYVYLWNPSIRRLVRIPHPTFMKKWATIGFGFVSETNDYKIVNIFHYGRWGDLKTSAEVYQLSTGSWKSFDNINDFLSNNVVVNYSPQCFFNGMIHWPASRSSLNNIATFDLKKDEFGLLKGPPTMFKGLTHKVCLFRDSLAVVQVFDQPLRASECWIWVMNDYGVYDSWTKYYTIDLKIGYFEPPLLFRQNGEVLLTGYHKSLNDLISYDPKNKQMKNLGIVLNHRIVCADYFVQSLVLLDNQSSIVLKGK